jgi:hypothetical protein
MAMRAVLGVGVLALLDLRWIGVRILRRREWRRGQRDGDRGDGGEPRRRPAFISLINIEPHK